MATLSFTNPSFTRPSLGKNIELKNPKRFNLMIRSPSLRITRCTMDVASSPSFDDGSRTHPKFPRMRVWDPYKRLGISKDASEEEIWSSRNFLIQQYAGHERSAESIEGAFERILMDSYDQRKKTKFNLKTRLKKRVEESPSWVKNLLDFVELPPPVIIMRRAFLFAFMAAWSVMKSADGGPAFQVAISLAACIYFLNDKTKSVTRASILGFGGLVAGWLAGSVIVPLVPSVILQPTWTLELLTSLVVYLFLFLSCTFLK